MLFGGGINGEIFRRSRAGNIDAGEDFDARLLVSITPLTICLFILREMAATNR